MIVFESGFIAKLHGECVKLRAVLSEFSEPGWFLEHGSALSVHNENHYFLKFAKHGVPGVQIRANMPDFMNNKFVELMKEAEHADEQRGEYSGLSRIFAFIEICFRDRSGTANDSG